LARDIGWLATPGGMLFLSMASWGSPCYRSLQPKNPRRRCSTKAASTGNAKVMSCEDIVQAQKKRKEREASSAGRDSHKQNRLSKPQHLEESARTTGRSKQANVRLQLLVYQSVVRY